MVERVLSPDERLADLGVRPIEFKRRERSQDIPPPAPLPDEKPETFSPTPFVWKDPASIPSRQWVYGRHLIRKFISVTVSPGGIGKSSLTIAEALCLSTGMNLLGQWVPGPCKVWLWNLEDPMEELERRFAATIIAYGIEPGAWGDRLFVDTGRQQNLCMAVQTRDGATIRRPVMDRLESEIKRLGIDVLIVDPFVSSHQVSENDNNAIDLVAKEWGRLADRCNIAVELVHHTRKTAGEMEATAESSRGAKALVDASRDTRALNRMTAEQAAEVGVENNRLYFRAFSDKANLAPPADKSDWYRLENVELENGDHVGVVKPWAWPDRMDGVTVSHLIGFQKALAKEDVLNRENVQATDWAGHLLGPILGVDTGKGITGKKNLSSDQASGRAKCLHCLSMWTANGALVRDTLRDTQKGKDIPIFRVGEWATT